MLFQAGLPLISLVYSPELIVVPLSNEKRPGPRSTGVLPKVRDKSLALQTPRLVLQATVYLHWEPPTGRTFVGGRSTSSLLIAMRL